VPVSNRDAQEAKSRSLYVSPILCHLLSPGNVDRSLARPAFHSEELEGGGGQRAQAPPRRGGCPVDSTDKLLSETTSGERKLHLIC